MKCEDLWEQWKNHLILWRCYLILPFITLGFLVSFFYFDTLTAWMFCCLWGPKQLQFLWSSKYSAVKLWYPWDSPGSPIPASLGTINYLDRRLFSITKIEVQFTLLELGQNVFVFFFFCLFFFSLRYSAAAAMQYLEALSSQLYF